MKTLSHKYPWHQHAGGESFFVPSLDPETTRLEGLRIGHKLLGLSAKLDARTGIHDRGAVYRATIPTAERYRLLSAVRCAAMLSSISRLRSADSAVMGA